MVDTDRFHLFRSKGHRGATLVAQGTCWVGQGTWPLPVLLLSLPTLSPSGPGLPLQPCQLLSLHCAGACPSVEPKLQGCHCPSAPACASLSNPPKADPCISSRYHCPRSQHFSIFLC